MRTNSNQLTYVTTFYVFLFWSFCSVCTVMMELVDFGTGAPVQKPHQHDQLEEWNTVSKLYYTVPYRIWIWNREFCIRKYKNIMFNAIHMSNPVSMIIIHQNWQSNRLFSVFSLRVKITVNAFQNKLVNEEFWQSFLSRMRRIKKFFDTETDVLFFYRQSIHSDLETRLLRQSLTLDHT